MRALQLERDGAIATITVNRPEARNAVDLATIRELEAVVGTLEESVRLIKQAVQGARDASAASSQVLEAGLFAHLWGSEDHAEAVQALFEKRRPQWRGR